MLPLNVRGNPVVHEGGRRNIMLLEDYIAAALCGVLDTQRVSHNTSDVWPGKHKVVGLNQQGVISELSPVVDRKVCHSMSKFKLCVYSVVFIESP